MNSVTYQNVSYFNRNTIFDEVTRLFVESNKRIRVIIEVQLEAPNFSIEHIIKMLMILFHIIFILTKRKPKLIQNVATSKYFSAVDRDLLLTEDKNSATPFCMKVGDGFNNLFIQVCDQGAAQPEKPEQSTSRSQSQQGDSLRRSNLIDSPSMGGNKPRIEEGGSAESALGGIRKNRDENIGLTLTVQEPVIGSEKLVGSEVLLEPERPTAAQAFRILQADELGTVRIMNENLCLTVNESEGSIGRKGGIVVVAACNKDDLNNQFRLLDSNDQGPAPTLDETKLAALKEVARVSPKMREKIGMDYLEMMS